MPLVWQVSAAVVALFSIVGIVHYLRTNFDDKIRVRMYLYIYMSQTLLLMAYLVLQPSHYETTMGLLVASASPLVAHYFSLSRTVLTTVFFFVALLLIFIFAITLGWLPVISANIGKSGLAAISGAGIVLPTATLAIAMASKYTRQIRATVLDELNKPYVAGARARGVPERTILVKHVLKSVMIMLVTLLALSIGDLLGGTAIV
jgi:peptide/nickel transport system permease protein